MTSFLKNAVLVAAIMVLAAGLSAQAKPDPAPLLGQWMLQVDAGGEFYFLPLEIKLAEGKLAGTLSEQSGMFTGLPMANMTWDGTLLKFEGKLPTPPDGAERLCKFEFKLDQGKLVGIINIEEMGMTAPVTGAKK